MNRTTRRPFFLLPAISIALTLTLGASRSGLPRAGTPAAAATSPTPTAETSSPGGLHLTQGRSTLSNSEAQRSEIRVAGLANSIKRFDAIYAAAKKGDLSSMALMGNFYYWQLVKLDIADPIEQETRSFEEAAKWFKKAADKGHAESQYNLGRQYYHGDGVKQNFGEAAKWFRKAADQEDAVAQFNLGVLFASGQGVPQDHAQAAKWYRKAADQGYAGAQFNLGVLYDDGQGVP